MADSGDGYEALQRTLWGYARHPNFAGILMVGLGCEVNKIPFLLDAYGLERGERFHSIPIQEADGTPSPVAAAIEPTEAMLSTATAARPATLPARATISDLHCHRPDPLPGHT